MDMEFSNLTTGRYFFNIQAIDKALRVGALTSYEIIIGSAKKIDPSVYTKVVQGPKPPKFRPKRKPRVVPFPNFKITRQGDKVHYQGSALLFLFNLKKKQKSRYAYRARRKIVAGF